MVETDVVEAVIGLGRKLFYNSGMESCLLVCRKSKPPARKGKVLFIEAENFVRHERSQSFLSDSDIRIILAAYRSNASIPGLSALVTLATVLENAASLNIKSYVSPEVEPAHEQGALRSGVSEFRSSSQALREGMSTLLGGVVAPDDESDEQVTQRPPLDRSRWRTVKLGDVAEEYTSRVDDPPNSGFTRYVGSDCVDAFDFRVRRWAPIASVSSAQKSFVKGDYLFVRRSLYGSDFRERSPRASFDGVCSADILTIREKPGAIADGFLVAVLYRKDLWQFVVANSTGSLTRRVKWKQLKGFEFVLPPIEEQKRIAELLWAGEHALEANNRALDVLRGIRRAMLHAIFVEKSYFTDNAIGYKDTPLGTLCDIRRGASPRPIGSPVWFSEEGPGWVRISDVSDSGKYLEKTRQFLSEAGLEKSVRVQRGSLIMSICATIGLPVITAIDACIHDGFVVFQNVSPDIMQDYLYYFILASRRAFENQGQLGTQKNLNTAIVKRVVLPLPTLEAQARCCDLLGNVESGIDETEKHIGNLVAMNTCLRETVLRRSHV